MKTEDIRTLSDAMQTEAELNQMMAALSEKLATVKDIKAGLVEESMTALRSIQNKPTGTVTGEVDGFKVSQTIPLKVTWDQNKLAEAKGKINAAGDDADEYIKTKVTYSVDERKFKKFDQKVKNFFSEARTTEHGKATYKYEPVS